MSLSLHEYELFKNDEDYEIVKATIESLVRDGSLKSCGLNPSETTRYVEIYKTSSGDTWHLALPDHAFRGYLKKM
ncbi:hypothetical protein Enr10x_28840 [Gimesia panareensis]|uniref:Uncharacterized protein n=1 Tax=Gimesia panareensis TaxID=2527978 RepID=A0A517Q7H6_9PLAN|nr:hypothetical protein Enr10x_28840 [Gimesia panareensis]